MIINKKKIHKNNTKFNSDKIINLRFNIVCFFIFISICLLVIRLVYLQLIYPKKLIQEGDSRSLRKISIPTTRGIIHDCFGHVLAISVPVYAIWINPKEIHKINDILIDKRWKTLSKILSIPIKKIYRLIKKHSKKSFLYLARQINTNIEDIIKINIPGLYLKKEERRYYPAREETSQLIGFTDIDGKGIEGVEKSFDKILTGHPGLKIVRKDRLGNVIEHISLTNEQPPHNITLSIDKKLQSLIYRKIKKAVLSNKAESGCAVLIDINTGEIKAIVNSPAYNPNNFNKKIIQYANIRNHAMTDALEPGSTIKPMVIMTALKLGIVNQNSIINTTPYIISGHIIKDVKSYNTLTLKGILQKSSNVGVSRLALSMPYSQLIDTYSRFGIGQPTNLGLTGENSGSYLHKKKWSKIERATFSFGYGLLVSPLQLARVYATIGSYGIYRPLSIIKVNHPVKGKLIFPKSIVKIVLNMMESVALPGGSGLKAAIKGYKIAIKTGTVKKVGKNNHYINEYIAYAAGIAPASKPLLALVVVINTPKAGKYYGGAVSAPVLGDIMRNVLSIMNIKPDTLLSDQKKTKNIH